MNRLVPVGHALFANAPYELVALVDRSGLLKLQLENKFGHQVEVLFEDHVYYRKMDEGDELRTLELVKAESCVGQTLVLTQDSELMDWVVDENFGVRSIDKLQHYMILALNDIVNVIAMSSPQISERATN